MNTTAFSASSVHIFSPWPDGQETFQESNIPARSRLYPLEPQAMGSLWQESFTSYLIDWGGPITFLLGRWSCKR